MSGGDAAAKYSIEQGSARSHRCKQAPMFRPSVPKSLAIKKKDYTESYRTSQETIPGRFLSVDAIPIAAF